MRTKLAALCLGLLALASACGDGGQQAGENEDDAPAATATAEGATGGGGDADGEDGDAGNGEPRETPDIERAPQGEVNQPREGTYVYDYESESTNAATPTASPRVSSDDAELTSKVTHEEGDIVLTEEKTTEGAATASSRWRWDDDRVVELSFETKTPQGSSGCTFRTPVKLMSIPIEKEKIDAQRFDGDGTSCDGRRTVAVEDREETEDANGRSWSTWRILIETEVRGMGVTNVSTITRWFSPDLGKDIRIETSSELVTEGGQVSARGESTSILKTYPS